MLITLTKKKKKEYKGIYKINELSIEIPNIYIYKFYARITIKANTKK